MSEHASENEAILQAAKEFGDVEFRQIETDGDDATVRDPITIAAVPNGRTLQSVKKFLDEYRVAPERKAGTSRLTTIDSFIAQVNRSKDENTVVFADVENRKAPKLLAVFDYNESGPKGVARFGKHRAQYDFPVSVEWAAWTAPRENIGQVDFAEFLENRIMDVVDPASLDIESKGTLAEFCRSLGIRLASPQALMELSKGLTVHANHKVVQYVNVGTGEAQIQFGENHTDANGAPVKVQGGFAIGIPVFRDGPVYQIPVRLRYRVKDGAVFWTLQVQRQDVVWNDAVTEAVNNVTTKTALTTLFGTPET